MTHPRPPRETERRKDPRSEAPTIRLRFGGHDCITWNWSLGGALLEEGAPGLAAGTLLDIHEVARRDGKQSKTVKIRARVARNEEGGRRLAVQFLEIDRAAYDFFSAVMGEGAPSLPHRPNSPVSVTPKHLHPALDQMHRWPARRSPGATGR